MATTSGKIIDGKKHAADIRTEVATQVASLAVAGKQCKLAVVLVGENPASVVYINMKKKACEEVGIAFELHPLPEAATQSEVIKLIDSLNANAEVTGILVQQPFPGQLNKDEILSRLDPRKDVDCLHPLNVGLAMAGTGSLGVGCMDVGSSQKADTPRLLPCTPAGCIELLKREGIEISGKRAVIVGRSDIVGKPLAMLLLAENATVTICHSRTKNLAEECRHAEILVAALGRPKFITADMVSDGAIVIDVGVNRLDSEPHEGTADGVLGVDAALNGIGLPPKKSKICGDVDYENVREKASYITPVPGGVGPMTVAVLMQNCVKARELQV